MPPSLLILALVCSGLAGAEDKNVEDPAQAPVVREVQPFVATITLRNPNDRAGRITRIDPSCTCTKVEVRDPFLLPHGTTTLDVVIDNHNRSGAETVTVSLYFSDTRLEPIEVEIYRVVRPCVAVDTLAPEADPLQRPADRGFQDVYRYVSQVRPDELHRLRKRIRVSCPPEETPPGGFKAEAVEYAGTIWKFATVAQEDGSFLITATARDVDAPVADGTYNEKVAVRTNHPDKASIELSFTTMVAKNAGERTLDPGALDPP